MQKQDEKVGLKLNIQKTKIMASMLIISWQIDGETMKQWQPIFSWVPKSLQIVTSAMKLKDACSLEKSYDKPRQHIKKQMHYFANNSSYSQSHGFSSSHVWMWELDHKEGWASNNWCLWTEVLEKILESLSDSKEIKPVNPKGNQPWIFIGRTDAETEAKILWPPDGKSWLFGRKDPNAGKDWRQDKKWMTEDKMVGWHHQLNEH